MYEYTKRKKETNQKEQKGTDKEYLIKDSFTLAVCGSVSCFHLALRGIHLVLFPENRSLSTRTTIPLCFVHVLAHVWRFEWAELVWQWGVEKQSEGRRAGGGVIFLNEKLKVETVQQGHVEQ